MQKNRNLRKNTWDFFSEFPISIRIFWGEMTRVSYSCSYIILYDLQTEVRSHGIYRVSIFSVRQPGSPFLKPRSLKVSRV